MLTHLGIWQNNKDILDQMNMQHIYEGNVGITPDAATTKVNQNLKTAKSKKHLYHNLRTNTCSLIV